MEELDWLAQRFEEHRTHLRALANTLPFSPLWGSLSRTIAYIDLTD